MLILAKLGFQKIEIGYCKHDKPKYKCRGKLSHNRMYIIPQTGKYSFGVDLRW